MKSRCLFLILFLFSFFSINILSQDDLASISEPDSGNWYEKLQIWKNAKPKYREVKDLKEKVFELNNQFLSKKQEDSKKLQDFYANLKIDRNTVMPKIESLISSIKIDENIDSSSLTDAEKIELDKKIKDKKDLEDLKSDFKMLFIFESNFETATTKLSADQLKVADSYEEKSLDSFERIENTLDDKKARSLFAIIENSVENLNAIIEYLDGPLMNSANESFAKMIDLRSKIEKSIKDLEQRGLIVSNLSDQEREEILNKLKPKEEPKKAECKEPVRNWWQKIIDFIFALLDYIWLLIKAPFVYIYSYFVTKK